MGSTDTEINWTKEHRHQPTSSEQTLAQRREHPYIWVTWLPRLLTGEKSCEWAIWFKAHYQDWTRTPSEFNQTEWMLNHTSLLNEQKTQWEARGQDVYVEGQNSFRLRGQSATLAGRPDLIVVRNDDTLVIDDQSWPGAASQHYVQIMIYMYALPRALSQYQHAKLAGEVDLSDADHTSTHTGRLHTQFIQNLGSVDPPIGGRQAARPLCRADRNVASATSARLDCPERMDEGSEPEGRTTTDF